MTFKPALIAVAAALSLNASAVLAEKWDMPMAYAATNYHSEHGVMFADKVKEYTQTSSVQYKPDKPRLVSALCQRTPMKSPC